MNPPSKNPATTDVPAAFASALLVALGQMPALVRGGARSLESAQLETLAAEISAKTALLSARLSPFVFTTEPDAATVAMPTAALTEAVDYFTVDGPEIRAAITCVKRLPNQGKDADFVMAVNHLAKRISDMRASAGV